MVDVIYISYSTGLGVGLSGQGCFALAIAMHICFGVCAVGGAGLVLVQSCFNAVAGMFQQALALFRARSWRFTWPIGLVKVGDCIVQLSQR